MSALHATDIFLKSPAYFCFMGKAGADNSSVGIKDWKLMMRARSIADLCEAHAKLTSKYVHACANGHEAIQLAAGELLGAQDYLYAYYRDDALLLGLGMSPRELMLQLFAKADDPFSGGRTYYSHPALKREGMPRIPHNSSATGMQAIPATGAAMGLQYRERNGLGQVVEGEHPPLVLCSIGDEAMTEGEVSEALHMATLKQLPILFLVQDNEWDISAHASEIRFGDATTLAGAYPGLEAKSVEGHDLKACKETMAWAFRTLRNERRPVLIHAKVPLLGHHTSGVRREWYRDDLEEHAERDPLEHLRRQGMAVNYSVEGGSGCEAGQARFDRGNRAAGGPKGIRCGTGLGRTRSGEPPPPCLGTHPHHHRDWTQGRR